MTSICGPLTQSSDEETHFRTPASIVSSGCVVQTCTLTLAKPTRPGVLIVSKMRSRTSRSDADSFGKPSSAANAAATASSSDARPTLVPVVAVADPQRICAACKSVDQMEVASAHEIVCTNCGVSVDASLMADVHYQYGYRSMADTNLSTWTRVSTSNKNASKRALVEAIQQRNVDCSNLGTNGANIQTPTVLKCPNSTGYKRVSHFMERLAQLQGQERVVYPDGLVEALRTQIQRLRIQPVHLSPQTVRFLLKKLRKPQFFENCNSLANLLGGFQLPKLNDELKEKLRTMFLVIQNPFEECSPPGRKNFLSYNFVLRKFLEILEQDHLLAFFPPLKSRDKNVEQELVWQRMCEKLDWPYYPTS